MDLTPLQLERELWRLKNELGQARERLNSRAADYEKAAAEFKLKYARAFMTARLDKAGYPSVEDCKMFAQSETSREEALYRASEQLVLNERKAFDGLLAEVDITRSLYSKCFEEFKRSG
jgi:hypothetical protein